MIELGAPYIDKDSNIVKPVCEPINTQGETEVVYSASEDNQKKYYVMPKALFLERYNPLSKVYGSYNGKD